MPPLMAVGGPISQNTISGCWCSKAGAFEVFQTEQFRSVSIPPKVEHGCVS